MSVKAVAHRALSGGAAANTLQAISEAIALGADAIEIDVHLTRDGKVVIVHDHPLNPMLTTRSDGVWLDQPGPVIETLTSNDIADYRVGLNRPQNQLAVPQGDLGKLEPIPELREALALISSSGSRRTELFIELKTSPEYPETWCPPEPITEAVIDLVREAGFEDHAILIAFDWRCLVHAKTLATAIRTGFLTFPLGEIPARATASQREMLVRMRAHEEIWAGAFQPSHHGGSVVKAIRAAGGDMWDAYHADLTPGTIAEAKNHGLQIGAWTVNDHAVMRHLIDLGVDAITTDDPAGLIAVRDDKVTR